MASKTATRSISLGQRGTRSLAQYVACASSPMTCHRAHVPATIRSASPCCLCGTTPKAATCLQQSPYLCASKSVVESTALHRVAISTHSEATRLQSPLKYGPVCQCSSSPSLSQSANAAHHRHKFASAGRRDMAAIDGYANVDHAAMAVLVVLRTIFQLPSNRAANAG